MTIYIVYLFFFLNFAHAKEFPHKNLILSVLSEDLVSGKNLRKANLSSFLSCKERNSSLTDCYVLLKSLARHPKMPKNQFLQIENHTNQMCLKKMQKIYSLARLNNLKKQISHPFCLSKITERIELIEYKRVDHLNDSI